MSRNSTTIVLLYHRLAKTNPDRGKNEPERITYSIRDEKFKEQREYLHKHGYEIISLHTLIDGTNANVPLKENRIIITFDDGHVSNYTLAYPILKKYGFKATFFVTAGWIGLSGYLSWPQIREMSANGMGIGSHTLTHPDLTNLGRQEIRYELLRSKEILEDGLGQSVDFLSIPESRYNKTIKQIARKVGYQGVCTGGWRPGYKYNDTYDLKRLGIKGYLSLYDFTSLVETRGKACIYRYAEVCLKSLFKKTMGIQRYRYIRDRWIEFRK